MNTKNDILQALGKKSVRSMTAFLKRHNCTPIKGHYGQHYHYHSGFFTSPQGQVWYWSTCDDRLTYGRGRMDILIRTAKDVKDFTGGNNQYPYTGEDFDNLMKCDSRLLAA